MRKRFKKKLRSCAMCKPHKTQGAKRHTVKDLNALVEWEKTRNTLIKVKP